MIEGTAIDEEKLNGFVHKALGDIGSALTASLVVVGDKLGLYRAMANGGPVTPAELAARTGFHHFRVATQTPFTLVCEVRP